MTRLRVSDTLTRRRPVGRAGGPRQDFQMIGPLAHSALASLFDALRRKVALLQDTIALMNEMRKGNSAGAAQIVDGLNKS